MAQARNHYEILGLPGRVDVGWLPFRGFRVRTEGDPRALEQMLGSSGHQGVTFSPDLAGPVTLFGMVPLRRITVRGKVIFLAAATEQT